MCDRRYWILVATALAIGFAFQGSRGLWETTEGRYAEAAREMLETGNWLVPQLDYHPHWTKPPLTYWAMMVGMELFGVNAWGVRLPNAVAYLFLVLVVAALGTAMWDRETGLLAGFIYATSLFATTSMAAISTDVILSLWQLLVVLAYWKSRQAVADPKASRWWMRGMWLFAGLAFLTKGPPGLFSLASVLIANAILRRRGRPVPRVLDAAGILGFFVVGLAWYVVVLTTTPGLLAYFIGDEIVGRVATNEFGRNPEWYQPFFVYLVPLIFGLLPWLAFWPAIARRYKGGFGLRALRERLREDDRFTLLAWWIGLSLVIFSLSSSRLELYVLPCFPVLVLLTARGTVRALDSRRLWRITTGVAAVMVVVLVGLKGYAPYASNHKNMLPLSNTFKQAARGDTLNVALNHGKLFGLQFYLGGKLERVAFDKDVPWSRRDWQSLLTEIAENPQHDRYLIHVAHGDDDRFKADMKGSPASVTLVRDFERSTVYAIDPAKHPPSDEDSQ